MTGRLDRSGAPRRTQASCQEVSVRQRPRRTRRGMSCGGWAPKHRAIRVLLTMSARGRALIGRGPVWDGRRGFAIREWHGSSSGMTRPGGAGRHWQPALLRTVGDWDFVRDFERSPWRVAAHPGPSTQNKKHRICRQFVRWRDSNRGHRDFSRAVPALEPPENACKYAVLDMLRPSIESPQVPFCSRRFESDALWNRLSGAGRPGLSLARSSA
jgi:hypothetical protein